MSTLLKIGQKLIEPTLPDEIGTIVHISYDEVTIRWYFECSSEYLNRRAGDTSLTRYSHDYIQGALERKIFKLLISPSKIWKELNE
jgi:hypothetical protein